MNAEFLLIVRLACHVVTVVMLARYFNPGGNLRWDAVICAGLLMASSASMAMQIMTTWHEIVASEPQPQHTIFTIAVMLPILVARGNMAHIIDWVHEHILRLGAK